VLEEVEDARTGERPRRRKKRRRSEEMSPYPTYSGGRGFWTRERSWGVVGTVLGLAIVSFAISQLFAPNKDDAETVLSSLVGCFAGVFGLALLLGGVYYLWRG
jgi:hypothetical protein